MTLLADVLNSTKYGLREDAERYSIIVPARFIGLLEYNTGSFIGRELGLRVAVRKSRPTDPTQPFEVSIVPLKSLRSKVRFFRERARTVASFKAMESEWMVWANLWGTSSDAGEDFFTRVDVRDKLRDEALEDLTTKLEKLLTVFADMTAINALVGGVQLRFEPWEPVDRWLGNIKVQLAPRARSLLAVWVDQMLERGVVS